MTVDEDSAGAPVPSTISVFTRLVGAVPEGVPITGSTPSLLETVGLLLNEEVFAELLIGAFPESFEL